MDPTENTSALDIIKKTLAFFGLSDEALNNEIDTLWRNKTITPNTSIDQIGIQLRDTQAFKNRFPANDALKAAGKPQYSVSEYLRLEGDFQRRLQAAGMPKGFYDSPQDFQKWIAEGVSPDELQGRIDAGYQAVRNAPKAVVDEFKRLYGASEGDLAAYFLDPERARPTFDQYEAQRQARAAVVASQAQQQAGITLGAQQAEELVRAGVTSQEAAQAGFTAIADQQELFRTTTSEAGMGEQAITQEEQIAGTFGTNAAARKKIAERKRQRQAAFEQGGGFTTTKEGISGLGTVGR